MDYATRSGPGASGERLQNIAGARGYTASPPFPAQRALRRLPGGIFAIYPGVQVNVDMIEGAEMIASVNQCSYDVYFAHEHMVSGNSNIDYFVTGTSQMSLVAHKKLADRIDMNDWSTLAEYPFVGALEAGFSLSGQIRRICTIRGIVPDIINILQPGRTPSSLR